MAQVLTLVAVLVIIVAVELRNHFVEFLSHNVLYYNTLSSGNKVHYNHKHGRLQSEDAVGL